MKKKTVRKKTVRKNSSVTVDKNTDADIRETIDRRVNDAVNAIIRRDVDEKLAEIKEKVDDKVGTGQDEKTGQGALYKFLRFMFGSYYAKIIFIIIGLFSAVGGGIAYWGDITKWLNIEVPSGAVVAYDLPECPEGWEAYEDVRGKFIRGIDVIGDIDVDRYVEHIKNKGKSEEKNRKITCNTSK